MSSSATSPYGQGRPKLRNCSLRSRIISILERETTALKHPLMAVIVFLVFIVVTPVGIQLAFMGIGGMRDN